MCEQEIQFAAEECLKNLYRSVVNKFSVNTFLKS